MAIPTTADTVLGILACLAEHETLSFPQFCDGIERLMDDGIKLHLDMDRVGGSAYSRSLDQMLFVYGAGGGFRAGPLKMSRDEAQHTLEKLRADYGAAGISYVRRLALKLPARCTD